MKKQMIVLALVTGSIALGASVAARADSQAFVSAGLGAGSLGMAGTASLNVVRAQRLYRLRVAAVEEFDLFGPSPSESAGDLAVMVGKATRSKHGLNSGAIGLGLAHSVKRGRQIEPAGWFVGPVHERIDRRGLGVAFELSAMLNARQAGLGVTAFGNVNTKNSFMAIAVTAQLGKLR